ncbi:phospholipase A2 inhibitor and Ly6/PLAUR domain-containing protein-like [Alligator sinensis]|uniref:Phospholipase A2 inhibitor and Ly6/PLAUR domain-containing protein-like n=1 Tax=Alligator sinensis TaxID=38654 RepID=A0A3Q0HJV8_ALLSI|nr:phospholipase A2 inhibitor and Ly6/PLAUR domain-containing protein-like [Alligator sinensis]
MKVPIILLFLSTLLVAGTCLECEVCSGIGNTCNGKMMACSSGEDSCFIALVELPGSFGSVKYIQTMKGCVTSRVCGRSPAIFHSSVTYRLAFTCCTGDSCKHTSVQLPAENIIPNGLYCPTCVTTGDTNDCSIARVACTGEETECLHLAEPVSSDPGAAKPPTPHKGCATPPTCNLGDAIKKFGILVDLQTCTKPTAFASSAAGRGRLLLPSFIGLILAMLLV